jgi:hypothetical protein
MQRHDRLPRTEPQTKRKEQSRCPLCGNELFLPNGAAFAGDGRICYTWACESCGHSFRTALQLFEFRKGLTRAA